MTESSSRNRFSFSGLLTASEQEFLCETRNWRWIASVPAPDIEPAIRHTRHRKWIGSPLHVHRPAMREVMFCLRGDTVFGFNGRVHRLVPGAVFLFGAHEARDWVAAPYQRNYATLWLHFDKRDAFRFNSFALDASRKPFRELPTRVRSGEAGRLIMDAWDQCGEEAGGTLCWTLLKAALTATLLEILGTAWQPSPPNPHRDVVLSVQEYIRSHPGEELTLEHLSRIAGYSPFFFHRLFLRCTGQTPGSYVRQVRLECAKELLRQGYTLEAITEKIGMRNPSYFSRFFKQRMQCSPGAWRAACSA